MQGICLIHMPNGLQDSFGSASWLVQREGGNVMMDSPRFDAKLLARIKVSAWRRAFVIMCLLSFVSAFAEWRVVVRPCGVASWALHHMPCSLRTTTEGASWQGHCLCRFIAWALAQSNARTLLHSKTVVTVSASFAWKRFVTVVVRASP